MRIFSLQFVFILGVLVFPFVSYADTGSMLSGSTSTGTIASGAIDTGLHSAASITTFSKLTDLLPKVFQINVYKYSEVFDRYTLIQYGSAVLIDTDKLITNAHVVYDADAKQTYFYQVCRSDSIKETPVCFSAAKLVRLDTTNDLALLSIENTSDLGSPVTISTVDQNVGDTVHVLGYPANGGETITVTEGTIAGYSKGYYKIDANLDEGNSGGGAFDDQGRLVGIPSFLADGYSSLGYILDSKLVSLFVDGKSGKAVSSLLPTSFESYLSSMEFMNDDGIIKNTFFETTSFKDIGFVLRSTIEKPTQNLYGYSLDSADGNVSIILQSIQRSSKTTPKNYTTYSAAYYKKVIPNTTSFSKTIGDTKWKIIVTQSDDGNTYSYIQDSTTSNIFFEAIIETSSDADESTLKDALSFVESISLSKLKAKHPPVLTPQFQLAGQQYSVFKSLTDETLSMFFVPQNGSFYGTLFYADLGKTLPTSSVLSGLASTIAYYTDGNASLVKSDQQKPFYTINYTDSIGLQHLAAIWLVKDKSTYCSISADLLLISKSGLTNAKKALQAFKVNSINK